MLKSLAKSVRKQLLKVGFVQRAVSESYWRKTSQTYHENWAKIMHAGRSVRPEELDAHDVLRIIEIDGLFVDYLGGRVVSQGYVDPLYIDSVNWGGVKI